MRGQKQKTIWLKVIGELIVGVYILLEINATVGEFPESSLSFELYEGIVLASTVAKTIRSLVSSTSSSSSPALETNGQGSEGD